MARTSCPKDIVENCRVLSIYSLNRDHFFDCWPWNSAHMKWVNKVGAVSYRATLTIRDDLNSVQITCEVPSERQGVPSEQVSYEIPLTSMPCHYGGQRYFFECPLVTEGVYCGRKVAKLYLPRGAKYFGCRHCNDLSYESRQAYYGGTMGLMRAMAKWAELNDAVGIGHRRQESQSLRRIRMALDKMRTSTRKRGRTRENAVPRERL